MVDMNNLKMRVYDRARQNLNMMGLNYAQSIGVTNIASGYMIAMNQSRQYLDDVAKDLLPVSNYVLGYKPKIEPVKDAQLIAITGMPGTGKTTLLEQLRDHKDVVVFDEFWCQGDDYDQQRKKLYDYLKGDKQVYVAACQVHHDVDYRIHLTCSAQQRKLNLQKRDRDISDRLRVQYFDSFNVYDICMFDSERVHAHIMQSR